MTFFAKKLINLMSGNKIILDYSSHKTGINQNIMYAYPLDLEPNTYYLKVLSNFLNISESELYFNNHEYSGVLIWKI